jgi:hypothetical protein
MDKSFRAQTFWIHAHLREKCRVHPENTLFKIMYVAPGNERAAALFGDMGNRTAKVVVSFVWGWT